MFPVPTPQEEEALAEPFVEPSNGGCEGTKLVLPQEPKGGGEKMLRIPKNVIC